MPSQHEYLDELLHDACIPLPPAEVEGAIVLQCHRDDKRRRSYFRVTLAGASIAEWDDPDQCACLTVLAVAARDNDLVLTGTEGGMLRLTRPEAIRHVAAGAADDKRSWVARLGIGEGEQPPPGSEVVPVSD